MTGRSVAWGVGAGAVSGATALMATGLPVVGLLAGLVGALLPAWHTRRASQASARARRAAWPEAIDDLRAQVRAGVGLPDALVALAQRGPAPLAEAFREFATDYRATGSFSHGLEALQRAAADPVADRVVAALALARELGGTELGVLLGTLSGLLRDDARTRAEIEARQSWTVTGARLAVAAPWLTLALLCTRPSAVTAFRTAAGGALLLTVAVLGLVAYLLMSRIGRLPDVDGRRP